MRCAVRAVTVLIAVPVACQAAAVPAWAGGIGGLLSPAIDNGCFNLSGSTAAGASAQGAGGAGGQVLGVPVSGPVNQCGGADLPLKLNAENVESFVLEHAALSDVTLVDPRALGIQ